MPKRLARRVAAALLDAAQDHCGVVPARFVEDRALSDGAADEARENGVLIGQPPGPRHELVSGTDVQIPVLLAGQIPHELDQGRFGLHFDPRFQRPVPDSKVDVAASD